MNEDKEYFYLQKAYARPDDNSIPSIGPLTFDTQHPEMITTAFLRKLYDVNRSDKPAFLPFFTAIEHSSDGFLLVTNHYTSPVYLGNVIGAANFDTIVNQEIGNARFYVRERENISALKCLDAGKFVTANRNCGFELWESQRVANGDKSVFKTAVEHTNGSVSHIDKLNGEFKLVAGTRNGHLYVFEYEVASLFADATYSYAHSSAITGVSAHPSSSKMWTTCSIDRSCALWDKSRVRPASRLLHDYENQITAVYWTTQEENKELVMIGDEVGNVLTLDPRSPNKILNKQRVANRGITKLSFNGSNQLGVIAKNSVANIFEVEDSGELKLKHTHEATGILYSMCWDANEKNTFYVVGEHKYAQKIVIL